MEQTLYGDILFLVNFTMDFLTLFITSSILKRKTSTLRLCLSASVGAVYGVAACFLRGSVLFLIAVNIAVSLLMCYIAFVKKILPCMALFYGMGCLLGGFMTALYGFWGNLSGAQTVYIDGSYRTLSGEIPLGWMAVVAAVIGIAAIAGGRFVRRERTLLCTVSILTEDGSFSYDGISDSGNLLSDPISGRAVILLRRNEFLKTVPSNLRDFFAGENLNDLASLPPELLRSVRLLPSSSVGGSKMLFGYIPKKVIVDGIERKAIIAMGGNEGFGGRAALVPVF